jgi:hypothetical protein
VEPSQVRRACRVCRSCRPVKKPDPSRCQEPRFDSVPGRPAVPGRKDYGSHPRVVLLSTAARVWYDRHHHRPLYPDGLEPADGSWNADLVPKLLALAQRAYAGDPTAVREHAAVRNGAEQEMQAILARLGEVEWVPGRVRTATVRQIATAMQVTHPTVSKELKERGIWEADATRKRGEAAEVSVRLLWQKWPEAAEAVQPGERAA